VSFVAKSTAELRGLSVPELEGRLVEIKSDLARERALIASGTRAEKPSKIRGMRRMVARILTIISNKKAGVKVLK